MAVVTYSDARDELVSSGFAWQGGDQATVWGRPHVSIFPSGSLATGLALCLGRLSLETCSLAVLLADRSIQLVPHSRHASHRKSTSRQGVRKSGAHRVR